jgi:hypothetical protein
MTLSERAENAAVKLGITFGKTRVRGKACVAAGEIFDSG